MSIINAAIENMLTQSFVELITIFSNFEKTIIPMVLIVKKGMARKELNEALKKFKPIKKPDTKHHLGKVK